MNCTRPLVITLIVCVAGGCARAPERVDVDLDVEIPEAWRIPTPEDATASRRSDRETGWWAEFLDPRLDEIVFEAVVHNHDLRRAAERVHAAHARARIARADTLPQLGLRYDGSRTRQNFVGLPIPNGPPVLTSRFTSHGLSLDVSWEVDVWGRLRAGQKAAIADRQAAAVDYAAATLSLVGQTTKAWFAVLESSRQLDLAKEAVERYRTTHTQVEERYSRGLRPSLDVRLALSTLAGAEATLAMRKGIRDRAARQLETLLGRYPAASIAKNPEGAELSTLPSLDTVPSILPADLVARRPDLVALERHLAAAGARVEEARKALYPRFSLTASGGSSSEELADLVDANFSVWRIAGNILQPIFQGGRLLAGIDLAKSAQREAAQAYIGAALRAYAEVESTLADEAFLAEREAALTRQVEQSTAAEELALDRYNRGLQDILTLLTAQVQTAQAKSRLLEARRLRLENRVDLHLALGGGFDRLEALQENDQDSDPELAEAR